jgi:ABC-2 type transport system permease protein
MSLVLRYGHAAEALIWGVPFLIQPISAVFYPVAVLPSALKLVAFALPSTYIFEGMRAVLNTGTMDSRLLAMAFGMNVVYLTAGGILFGWTLRLVRRKGYLSRTHIE